MCTILRNPFAKCFDMSKDILVRCNRDSLKMLLDFRGEFLLVNVQCRGIGSYEGICEKDRIVVDVTATEIIQPGYFIEHADNHAACLLFFEFLAQVGQLLLEWFS